MFLGEEKQEDWVEKVVLPLQVDYRLMLPERLVDMLENWPQFSLSLSFIYSLVIRCFI